MKHLDQVLQVAAQKKANVSIEYSDPGRYGVTVGIDFKKRGGQYAGVAYSLESAAESLLSLLEETDDP